MNEQLIREVSAKISKRLKRSKKPVPVGVSHRHLHLCQEDWEVLFGIGTEPRKVRTLVQPGFFACHETVHLVGPKGRLDNVRVIGPHRAKTQIEISRTDATVLGVRPPVRDAGALEGSAGVVVLGPVGELELKEGVILAKRHIHFAPEEARGFGVQEGELVRVRAGIDGHRELVFEKVVCRISDKFKLEFHLDTDEANASLVKTGDTVYIV